MPTIKAQTVLTKSMPIMRGLPSQKGELLMNWDMEKNTYPPIVCEPQYSVAIGERYYNGTTSFVATFDYHSLGQFYTVGSITRDRSAVLIDGIGWSPSLVHLADYIATGRQTSPCEKPGGVKENWNAAVVRHKVLGHGMLLALLDAWPIDSQIVLEIHRTIAQEFGYVNGLPYEHIPTGLLMDRWTVYPQVDSPDDDELSVGGA